MKTVESDNVKAVLILIPIIILSRVVGSLPWFSFVFPVLAFGAIISFLKWRVSGFGVGFFAGFIIWIGLNLYFDVTGNGLALQKIGILFSIPKIIVFILTGITGGLQVGLALYTGSKIFSVDNKYSIDKSHWS